MKKLLSLVCAVLIYMSLPITLSAQDEGPFKLPPLPYSYDAFEPYVDAQTMTVHLTLNSFSHTSNYLLYVIFSMV